MKKIEDAKEREKYGLASGYLGIVLNLFLFGFKLFAGIISGSISIVSDSLNNLSDGGSSIITMVGFKLAGQKADSEHPYGHGRMEYIAGFGISAIIIAMGLNLIKESITKIIHPDELSLSPIVLIILIVSILVKCVMALYNFRIGSMIDSATVKATAKDSLSDCFATAMVLISSIIYYLKGINVDGICGCIVALFVLYAGYSSLRESINPLLGTPPEKEFIDEIENIVVNFDENIVGIHDIMVHDYGPGRKIISLHAEVPSDGDILEIHDVVDRLEKTLDKKLNCLTTIHMDPIATSDPRVKELKHTVAKLAASIFPEITVHDFRVVWGNTHTNMMFDVVIPFTCKMSDKEVIDRIRNLVYENIGKEYLCVIEIDRSYN